MPNTLIIWNTASAFAKAMQNETADTIAALNALVKPVQFQGELFSAMLISGEPKTLKINHLFECNVFTVYTILPKTIGVEVYRAREAMPVDHQTLVALANRCTDMLAFTGELNLRYPTWALKEERLGSYKYEQLADAVLGRSKELRASPLLNGTISRATAMRQFVQPLIDHSFEPDQYANWTVLITKAEFNVAVVCSIQGKYMDVLQAACCLNAVHDAVKAVPSSTARFGQFMARVHNQEEPKQPSAVTLLPTITVLDIPEPK